MKSEGIIRTRKELNEWVDYEKKLYKLKLFDILTRNQMYYNWKYIKLLRYCEYYRNCKNVLLRPLFVLTRLRRNILGKNIGVEVGENCCGKGLLIYHNGSIVINGFSNVGENCKFHGCNCVGNMGDMDLRCPTIGDNVEFGVGAMALGGIVIGDNIQIGANTVVLESFCENGITIVGSPARKV